MQFGEKINEKLIILFNFIFSARKKSYIFDYKLSPIINAGW